MSIFKTDGAEFLWLQDDTFYSYRLVPGSVRGNRRDGRVLFRLASVEDASDSHEVIITDKGGRYTVKDDLWPGEEFDVEAYFTKTGAVLYADDEECRVLYRLHF